MKKIVLASLKKRDCTSEKYICFLSAIAVAVSLIFAEDLFVSHFVFRDVIYEGELFLYLYWGLGMVMVLWPISAFRKGSSFVQIILAGITPAMMIWTIKQFLNGRIVAGILIGIMIGYVLLIVVQIACKVIGKKPLFFIMMQAWHKVGTVMMIVAFIGGIGYWTGNGVPQEAERAYGKTIRSVEREWDENIDMLLLWKEENYMELEEEEKKQIWQAVIDMESNYLGIDSPIIEIETYDVDSIRSGYYSKAKNRISIRDDLLYAEREEVMNVLLHEVNHAYTRAVADTVEWKDINEPDKKLRIYADAYVYKEAEENYIDPEVDIEGYYQNALEIAARNYADEWEAKYIRYIDEL